LAKSRQQRVLDSFARWNAGDRTAPLDEIHPDVEMHTVFGDAFAGEPFRGHEGTQRWLHSLDENFERWEIHAEEFEEQGDVLVVRGEVRAQARASGVELVQGVSWIFRFQDDLVIYMQTFFDRDGAPAVQDIPS
jgi:ketosteroid isomerase-like protein